MKIKFSRRTLENSHILNFMKIRQMGAELVLVDRRDEADNRFSQFYEGAFNKRIFTVSTRLTIPCCLKANICHSVNIRGLEL